MPETIKQIYDISNKNRKINKQRKKNEVPQQPTPQSKEKSIYDIIKHQYEIDEKENGDYKAVMKQSDQDFVKYLGWKSNTVHPSSSQSQGYSKKYLNN